jgi:hypothetical protein
MTSTSHPCIHIFQETIFCFFTSSNSKNHLSLRTHSDVYQNHLFWKKIPSVLSRSSATEKNVNLVLIRGQVCFVSLLSRSKSANIQSSSNERRSKGTFYLNHSLSGLIHFYSFDSSKVHFFRRGLSPSPHVIFKQNWNFVCIDIFSSVLHQLSLVLAVIYSVDSKTNCFGVCSVCKTVSKSKGATFIFTCFVVFLF